MKSYVIALVMIFLLQVGANAAFEIHLYDQKGRRITEIPVGQQFTLKATVQDASRASNQVIIHGLAPFDIMRSITRMTHVNGLSLVTHERELRASAQGVYTLGPAEYNENGVTHRSNVLQLKVVHAAQAAQAEDEQAAEDRELAFLELTIDKKTVYVGEKVTCTLMCYFLGSELAISSLNQPTLEGWHIAEQPEEARGKKEINGRGYDVVMLVWQMCATAPGNQLIPAFGADFLQELPAHAFPFGFGMFRQNSINTKRFYSNQCKINVLPLPESNKEAQAVGTFTDFSARINQATLKTGDAVNLTLTLKGDGDWDRIVYKELHNMPAAFKWYDSKTTRQKDALQFEFVVQALEPGTWEIPAQPFTYFDTKSHTYKILESAPLRIKVLESKVKTVPVVAPPELEAAPLSDEKPEEEIILAPLYREMIAAHKERVMQWWFFWTLVVIFFALGMFPVFQRTYAQRIRTNMRYYAYKKAYIQAHKQLRIARMNHNAAAIYTIIIELCAARLKVQRESLTHHMIEQELQENGMDHHAIQEWRQFIEESAQYAFTPAEVDEHIFDRAQKWLGQLKGII